MTTFQKAQLVKSMQKLDYDMRLSKYPAVIEVEREEEPARERDAEEFFAAEQCPADSNFR